MIAALVVMLALAAPSDDAVRKAIVAKVQAEVGPGAEVVVGHIRMGDASLGKGAFELSLNGPLGVGGQARGGRVKGKILSHGRETWLSAEVELRGPAVVATRAIARGATIGQDDVRLEPRRLDDALTDPTVVIGATARFDVRAGEVIGEGTIERPMLVRRGDPVTARVTEAAFRVSAAGEALDSGRLGARVSVRILDGKVIEGRVVGPGEVEVSR